MASDANLIKGARDAASGASKMAMAGAPLGAAAAGLLEKVDARTADLRKRTEEAKERSRKKDEKFDENTEAALAQGGALGEAEYEFTRRKVDNLQQEYQKCDWHDDACRKKVMMALSKESQGLTAMKDTRDLNSKALLNMRGDVGAEQLEVMSIYANSQSGKYTMAEGKDGEIRYTFDLGEDQEASYTKNELDKMFESQKDNVGMEATKQRGLDNVKRGRDGEAYSEEQEGAAFDNLTKTENSLRSYLNDEWLGGENFSGSMSSKIDSDISAAYQVHLEHPSIQSFDIPVGDGETNWYDNITKEDKALIKQRLMNPETEEELAISREVAREHYINAQRQQHEKGVKEANDAMLDAQKKEANKYLFEEFKNNLKIGLDGAQTENDAWLAYKKHLNKLDEINQKEENLIGREDKKKGIDQQAVIDYWNNKVIPKSEEERLEFNKQGPTDKAQHFSREFQTATGDNTVNIKYSGKPFTDSSGRQVSSGYYIPQLEDVVDKKGVATGEKQQVFQLISEGDNIEATDILSWIKKGKSISSSVSNTNSLANKGTVRK